MTSGYPGSTNPKPISPNSDSALPFGIEGEGWVDQAGVDQTGTEQDVQEDPDQVISEEAIIPNHRKKPTAPTRQEYLDHQLVHMPFRQWCPICVKARGKAHGHRVQKPEEKTKPTVHVDYWIMRDFAGGNHVTVVSLKEDRNKLHASHCVQKK